MKKKCPNVMVK